MHFELVTGTRPKFNAVPDEFSQVVQYEGTNSDYFDRRWALDGLQAAGWVVTCEDHAPVALIDATNWQDLHDTLLGD